jgi:hypothetical protein
MESSRNTSRSTTPYIDVDLSRNSPRSTTPHTEVELSIIPRSPTPPVNIEPRDFYSQGVVIRLDQTLEERRHIFINAFPDSRWDTDLRWRDSLLSARLGPPLQLRTTSVRRHTNSSSSQLSTRDANKNEAAASQILDPTPRLEQFALPIARPLFGDVLIVRRDGEAIKLSALEWMLKYISEVLKPLSDGLPREDWAAIGLRLG